MSESSTNSSGDEAAEPESILHALSNVFSNIGPRLTAFLTTVGGSNEEEPESDYVQEAEDLVTYSTLVEANENYGRRYIEIVEKLTSLMRDVGGKYVLRIDIPTDLPSDARQSASGADSAHAVVGLAVYIPPPEKQKKFFLSYNEDKPKSNRNIKQNQCVRVLLITHYLDGKWAIPGGKMKERETPVEAVNREFREETGCSTLEFDGEEDLVFSREFGGSTTYFFCKTTSDGGRFREWVTAAPHDDHRAFEVYGKVDVPVFVETRSEVDDRTETVPMALSDYGDYRRTYKFGWTRYYDTFHDATVRFPQILDMLCAKGAISADKCAWLKWCGDPRERWKQRPDAPRPAPQRRDAPRPAPQKSDHGTWGPKGRSVTSNSETQ